MNSLPFEPVIMEFSQCPLCILFNTKLKRKSVSLSNQIQKSAGY